MWFANMGCIEVHPFHSRASNLEHPDYAIFDFDPAEGSTWDQVVAGTLHRWAGPSTVWVCGDTRSSPGTGDPRLRPDRTGPHLRTGRRFVGRRPECSQPPTPTTSPWSGTSRNGRARCSSTTTATPSDRPSPRSTRSVPGPAHPSAVPLAWSELGRWRTASGPSPTYGIGSSSARRPVRPGPPSANQTLDEAEGGGGIPPLGCTEAAGIHNRPASRAPGERISARGALGQER
jgi:hypothetical protein